MACSRSSRSQNGGREIDLDHSAPFLAVNGHNTLFLQLCPWIYQRLETKNLYGPSQLSRYPFHTPKKLHFNSPLSQGKLVFKYYKDAKRISHVGPIITKCIISDHFRIGSRLHLPRHDFYSEGWFTSAFTGKLPRNLVVSN